MCDAMARPAALPLAVRFALRPRQMEPGALQRMRGPRRPDCCYYVMRIVRLFVMV